MSQKKIYLCCAKVDVCYIELLYQIRMEIYEAQNNYKIVDISRSSESLSEKNDDLRDEVMLSFLPYLILDVENKVATTILTSQFVKKDNTPLTNKLVVHVTYKFNEELPLVQVGIDKVKILNYEDLLSIFDTSIGVFRGILFEWLKNSRLQQPLPAVNIEEFLKELRISFSK